MSFLAASVFMQMLKQFKSQVDDDEIDEKVRYAKWKATDIVKCLREGRKPQPGPLNASSSDQDQELSSVPFSTSDTPSPPKETLKTALTPPANAPLKQSPQTLQTSLATQVDPLKLDQAQKYSRYAISALQYEDVKAAIDNLEKALAILKPLIDNK